MKLRKVSTVPATTGIRSITIESRTPCFDGASFGATGPYEKLQGTILAELDPEHALNKGIVNLALAPRNAQGLVEYRVDLCILKPVDLSKGNGWLFYEVLNRGGKRAICRANTAPATNDPTTLEDAGNGFLMREGYTMVWTGWQSDLTRANNRMIAEYPVPNDQGSPITGLSLEEFIDGTDGRTFVCSLTYPSADQSPDSATLTVRQRERDPRQTPDGLSWRYLDEKRIEITRPHGEAFDRGAIYEFVYRARDPHVTGIAFASIRDIVSFFLKSPQAQDGSANPLASEFASLKQAMLFGISQSGRFVRDYLYQGFNEAISGGRVFEAAVPVIAGSRRTFINWPFAQPGRYSRQHENHNYPDDQFPFTYRRLTDPISGKTDGILDKCLATDTAPKIVHLDTDAEIWSARASLVVTDCEGHDIEQPDNVRVYLASGIEHGNPEALPEGVLAQQHNPLFYGPMLRPLLKNLADWVEHGVEPPASCFPSRRNGTLVAAGELNFASVPGLQYRALINDLRLMDYSVLPPREGERVYPIFVVKVDSDGNPVDGILHPLLRAPLGTHLGWNLRSKGHAEGELYSIVGAFYPFAHTSAVRAQSNDSRPSITERYGDRIGWVRRLELVCNALIAKRHLLAEDADTLVKAARKSWDVLEVI